MKAAARAEKQGDIVVIGGGGHAKVLVSILKKARYRVIGYTDRADRGLILGIGYLGDDTVLDGLPAETRPKAVLGIGKIDLARRRLDLQRALQASGFAFPAICSPQALINDGVLIGAGTVVMDRVVVNSGAVIGEASILNTGSIVEHDCRIGDNVHVASGATVAGGVSVGDHCMLGAGCTVIQSVTIGAGCIIGAGATVVRSISAPGTYVGSPAKQVR